MSFIPNRDANEHGFLMNLRCDLGLVSASLPAWLVNRADLDLEAEGVSTSGKIALFQAVYTGEQITVDYMCPMRNEMRQKVIFEPGQVVTGGAGKGSPKAKINALFEDVKDAYGKALTADEGQANSGKIWYWSSTGMPKAMQAHNLACQWRDEYFLPLMQGELYTTAKADFEDRVDNLIAKVRASINGEISRINAAINAAGPIDSLIKLRDTLNGQLADLPQVQTSLKGKFPTREKVAESFKVYHTKPKPVPSLVAQVQSSAEAMEALNSRLSAEAGAQAAALTISSLQELGDSIPSLIASLKSELYELVATAIKDLRKIKPDNPTDRVKGLIQSHLDRLRVVGEMLSDFGAWASEEGEFDHGQALERIAALSEKIQTSEPGTTDREELVRAIDSLTSEIADEVVYAKMDEMDLGKGANTLAEMALNIISDRPELPPAEEFLTPQNEALRALLAEVNNPKTTVRRLRAIAPEVGVNIRDEAGSTKGKPDLQADLLGAINNAIAETQVDFREAVAEEFAML